MGQSNQSLIVTFEQSIFSPRFQVLEVTIDGLYTYILIIWACCWSNLRSPSLISKSLSNIASLAANINVIYLVSVEKRAMVAYLIKYQLIDPQLNMKINPEIDFRLFLSLV